MKIILLEDVKSVGKKGSVVEVSSGYATNFLFPKKLAIEATKNNMNILDGKNKSEDYKKQVELEEAQKISNELKDKKIKISAKVGNNGKLFGAVTNKEISKAIKEQTNLTIDKKKIILEEQFKAQGEFEFTVKLHQKVSVKMKVEIVAI